MTDLALNYEYLIRRAFQCGRYGVAGANADTYRGLSRRYLVNKDNKDTSKKDDLLFEYAFYCGEVSAYILSAIEKFTKDFEDSFTDEENEEINSIQSLLNNAKIEAIDKAILRTEALMIKYGRNPK